MFGDIYQAPKVAFFDALTNGYWCTRSFSTSFFSTSNFMIFRLFSAFSSFSLRGNSELGSRFLVEFHIDYYSGAHIFSRIFFEAVASIVSFYTQKGYYIYIGILHIYRYNYTYEKCRPESKSAELRCVR